MPPLLLQHKKRGDATPDIETKNFWPVTIDHKALQHF
jgi:hypothetical protein